MVILRQDERGNFSVLLVKRSDIGVWTIPGGRREPGESLEGAAVREAKEETGYDVTLIRQLGMYRLPHLRAMGEVFIFVGAVRSGTQKISAEIAVVRWFPVNCLPYTLLPFHREKIQAAVAGKSGLDVLQPHTFGDIVIHYLPVPWILWKMWRFYRLLKRRDPLSL